MKYGVAVIVLLVASVAPTKAQKLKSPRIYVESTARPTHRSIVEVLENADQILIGQVVKIEGITFDPIEPGFPRQLIERVTLADCATCRALKNYPAGVRDVKGNKNLTDSTGTVQVLLSPGGASRLNEGDRVLWFLGPQDDNGVRPTVGAGLFIIEDEGKELFAENDYENTRLWISLEELWKVFPRVGVRNNLVRTFVTSQPMALAMQSADKMLGSLPTSPRGPLPLDLLLAIVSTAR